MEANYRKYKNSKLKVYEFLKYTSSDSRLLSKKCVFCHFSYQYFTYDDDTSIIVPVQYSTVLVLVLAVLHEYLLVKYKYEHSSK